MGTDIHIQAEKLDRKTMVWETIPVPRHLWSEWHIKYADDPDDPDFGQEWVDFRNYSLFAMLADVRNGYGFAGISTGTGFKPISKPRGLPEDISQKVKRLYYEDGGHSESWLSLREVMEYPVKDLRTKRRGCLKVEDLRAWRKTKSIQPPSWCGWTSGPNVHHVTPEALEGHLLNPPPETAAIKGHQASYYAEYEWEVSYFECAPDFFGRMLPALVEIAGDDIDDVRFVFFFDN